jgi:hypothetical protein
MVTGDPARHPSARIVVTALFDIETRPEAA